MGKVAERACYRACTLLEPCWVWAWAAEGKDGWEEFVQEASGMGLGRRLLRMPFCDDQGLQGIGLHRAVGAARQEWEKMPKSVMWPKYLCGTPCGGDRVHVLLLASSAKGVVKVNV